MRWIGLGLHGHGVEFSQVKWVSVCRLRDACNDALCLEEAFNRHLDVAFWDDT